ncbi:hypothetical protein ABIC16_004111 [Sphingomonas sp. PvP055]|uniref:HNH endonuclease n=1 Tax=Sphingomonas sp. PvP055 TaxID=3156391 RepID=UPI00339997CA
MAIAEKDIKQLWGLAGGYCSNPDCRSRVAITSETGESYLTGEMAHIVARQAAGPRGDGVGGPDTYENLVLLCPTCHTKVDKAPCDFPVDMLLGWKSEHERWVDSWAESQRMKSTKELMEFISALLVENHHYFEQYGPRSAVAVRDPSSSAYAIWLARRLDTILPNNRKIVAALDANAELVPADMRKAVLLFRDHAAGYEQHQYERLDHYELFPASFAEGVEKYRHD